jgi:all-trans-8'-apo-beta-carotenal 15,15'-oxygenase
VLHFFDARDGGIAAGPVASVELEDHLPPGLHGYWSTALHN